MEHASINNRNIFFIQQFYEMIDENTFLFYEKFICGDSVMITAISL